MSKISDDAMAELREAFEHFDKDSNGTIDASEFASLLENLGAGMSEAEVATGAVIAKPVVGIVQAGTVLDARVVRTQGRTRIFWSLYEKINYIRTALCEQCAAPGQYYWLCVIS